MTRLIIRAVPVLALCLLLTGCGASGQTPPETEAAVETTLATTVPETTIPTVPETTAVETEPTVQETEHSVLEAETVDTSGMTEEERRLPLLELPEGSDEPCHFFDDAAFMGDSISYSLMVHHTKTKDFGDAIFLVRGSLGIHNTLNKQLTVSYQGKPMTPWDALAASGVNKVFIMMGMNDIGYYSIDETMEKWEIFLANLREKSPEIEIYIQSLTPMWDKAQQSLLNNENIDLYNVRLQEFAQANDCHFVNIAPYFKNADNGMAALYCGDLYVHMNETGTAAWATLLKVYGWEQETKES